MTLPEYCTGPAGLHTHICSGAMIDSQISKECVCWQHKGMSWPAVELQRFWGLDFKGDRVAVNLVIHSSEST